MDNFPYEDIINLPHHRSKKRKPMPISVRGAQFAPFAALTGHGDAVNETARLTDSRIELDEYTQQELNRRLVWIKEHIDEDFEVKITYFVPDEKKKGGKYVTKKGIPLKIKEFENILVMTDRCEIPICEIIEIESPEIDFLEFE